MGKPYQGEIDRLIIFAGPSGSGKSSFLEKPETRLSPETLPVELHEFYELAKNHETVKAMKNRTESRSDKLCLHVDLTNPVRWIKSQPETRDDLLEELIPEMFQKWEELNTYLKNSKVIHLVTFFVRREEHFLRWTGRALKSDPEGKFIRRVAAVNGDSSKGSELHRAVYRSWIEFIEGFKLESEHILDGNGETYSFMKQEDFQAELKLGY